MSLIGYLKNGKDWVINTFKNMLNESQSFDKEQCKAARKAIGDYHKKKLAELQKFVYDKFQDFYAGKIDAFELDHVIHIYHRQSQELFKFVNAFYGENRYLGMILKMIKNEEKGDYCWEPEIKQD